MKVNFRVEYEELPIRHASVECPHCGKWFRAEDIANRYIICEPDIRYATYCCPVCDKMFTCSVDGEACIEEVPYPDVYEGCLTKKEVWE